jgi:glycosyltransferase involved in cell wall biosynthesis
MPNLVFNFNTNCDLIHCAHCLSLNNKPWVVDTEVYDRVSAGGNIAYSLIGKAIIKNRLRSKNCKKILVWSEDCKKSFEEAFPDDKDILNKITLVPFALPVKKFKKIEHKGKVVLLFLARWFDAKGGRQTLEVFDRLTKKHKNVEAIFICPTPEEFRKRYSANKNIKMFELMPQEKLFREIYPSADIFVYPGFGDSYGFAMPEASAFGLPIVTVDSFARREIVQDGKTGFIVERPKSYKDYSCMDEKMLNDLANKTSILIENPALRKKMGQTAMKEVESGKFSINNRNKKLRSIYEEALRSN